MTDDEFAAKAFGIEVGEAWQNPLPPKTWAPHPDITTYELAQCVGFMMLFTGGYNVAGVREAWDRLTPEAQRHFKEAQ